MIILGLTGSIGMGKSTAAKMLEDMNVPVHDSDATVHELLGVGGAAVAPIKALAPEAVSQDAGGADFIDRKKLGPVFFTNPALKQQVEDVLFPLVRASSDAFVKQKEKEGYRAVALDIPLLFETGGEARVDKIIVVTAPADVQRERVLARGPESERAARLERLEQILKVQVPDAEKRRRADFVVETDKGLDDTRQQLKRIVDSLLPPPAAKPKFCL
ncbi:MAG: dephospho-CoA kinase [Micavibrio sp.]|nr:dephospho-CoA kinase [Micavibrio sp.]